eukprot:14041688-Ditylum_brightwellii.AAC.1
MNFPMLTIKEPTTTIKGTDEYMSKFDKKKYPVAEKRYALKIAFKDKVQLTPQAIRCLKEANTLILKEKRVQEVNV